MAEPAPSTPRRPRRAGRENERDARLRQLAELGKLSAGLAHELKNPLSTLKLNLQLLQEDLAGLPGAENSRNRAATLWKVADRLTQTLDSYLRFAGRVELRKSSSNVALLVQDLVDFIHPQAAANHVRVHTSFPPEPVNCQLDATLIKQALMNLMINALQAMPQGGDLIIRVHTTRDRVFIDVSDTGGGIPPENLPHIFDAYFTTKKGGTGLGLPTTRRLIEEHRGHINVTSDPGQGTNFRIELPCDAE